jgi:ankyrin repeat protein
VVLTDGDEKTALYHAIINDPGIVKLLFQYNVSPVKPDKRKQTPLHLACRLGNQRIVIDIIRALKEGESVNSSACCRCLRPPSYCQLPLGQWR